MGGNVDTFLMQNEQKDWGSKKGTRRAVHRQGLSHPARASATTSATSTTATARSEADRLKFFEENKDRWGREWLVIANPTYGSFDAAPFGFDYKKSDADKRKAKWDVLEGWAGPKSSRPPLRALVIAHDGSPRTPFRSGDRTGAGARG